MATLHGHTFKTIDGLFHDIQAHSTCPFCRKSDECTQDHISKKHLKSFHSAMFCGQVKDLKRSHWHCFKCGQILQRLPSFKIHLQKHGCILNEDSQEQFTEKKPERSEERENCPQKQSGEDSFKCTFCQSSFARAGSLRRHQKERHEKQTDPIYCVDVEKGIFITAKSSRGQRIPIHVQKSTTSQVIGCEVEECREYMTLAKASGMPGLECEHFRRVPHAHPYVAPQTLKHGSIDLMHEKGLISSSRKEECWYCLCKATKKQYRCIHIYLSMWWLYQEREDLLVECTQSASEGDSFEEEEEDADICLERKDGLTKKQIVDMTTYLWQMKRIPENLPQELKIRVSPLPARFEPTETTCPYCPGPTPPGLTEMVIVTKNAIIYDLESIQKGVTVCVKKCLICRTPVRFQDFTTGFHNLNITDNRILLTIRFCSMMTSALKDLLNVKIHHNTLRKAAFHFWAMTSYHYDFSCVRCGHEPPVLIADANWKVAFDLPASTVSEQFT
ncbi:uncharacterized protein [Hoplias malabaricus]|uniref:uncharacterized protein isoform X2 n=1 Tax=Hoplias malabaricus TaxID=27720 RepID=UPI003462ECA1